MNFLSRLSIAQKLYLIPLIGSLLFIIYLVITYNTASSNVDLLEDAKGVQFPALLASREALVNMEKVKETLSAAVTTGDEESLDRAQELAQLTQSKLREIGQVDPTLRAESSNILSGFDTYYETTFDVSKSMVDGTADYSKLAQ